MFGLDSDFGYVIVGSDFDGVIVDTVEHRAIACSEVYGIDPPYQCFANKTVVSEGYLTQQQYDDLMDLIFLDEQYAMMMRPLPGAVDSIHSLIAEGGLTPRIVTMRQRASLRFVRRLLNMDEIGLGDLGVIATDREMNKHQYAEGMLAFIDDRVGHLETMRGIVPNLFLMDYYQVAEPSDWYTVVPDWYELLPKLLALA